MPFALALFLIGSRTLAEPNLSNAALTGVTMLLSLLAKPNYVLAFAPCFAIALTATVLKDVVKKLGRVRTSGLILFLAFGPAMLCLLVQFALLARDSSIMYEPLAVWGLYCKQHYTGSVLIGIVFPLSVVICYPIEVNNSQSLVLAWATLAVSIATFALFAEFGGRISHANFAWGMTLADHVLFVVSAAFLLKQRGRLRQTICFAALGLQALAGAVALVRYYV
jgi:hypothetical protein